MVSLRVEVASEEDAQAIAGISSEVAKEGTVKELKPDELVAILSSKTHYVAVAKLDGEIVGYAMSSYSWGKLHVLDLAVSKDRRKMGIGKMLVKHLIQNALSKGLHEAYCEVRVINIPALNLFTSLGFKFRLFSPLVQGGFYGLYLPLRKNSSSPP